MLRWVSLTRKNWKGGGRVNTYFFNQVEKGGDKKSFFTVTGLAHLIYNYLIKKKKIINTKNMKIIRANLGNRHFDFSTCF